RAERQGDNYVINGSKIWTSYAGLAQHCFLLARTGGSGRQGICIFLVPMQTPGITVRPIPSLIGEGDRRAQARRWRHAKRRAGWFIGSLTSGLAACRPQPMPTWRALQSSPLTTRCLTSD
ncbi:MAG: acyl-CoA dehydrogenase family protein, partial [Candidimonas sp.]